jgi:hypothetical protein
LFDLKFVGRSKSDEIRNGNSPVSVRQELYLSSVRELFVVSRFGLFVNGKKIPRLIGHVGGQKQESCWSRSVRAQGSTRCRHAGVIRITTYKSIRRYKSGSTSASPLPLIGHNCYSAGYTPWKNAAKKPNSSELAVQIA